MAPSRAVSVAAGTALLVGLAFMIYLLRRRKRGGTANGSDQSEKKQIAAAGTEDAAASLKLQDAENDTDVENMFGKIDESITVSQSWAILSGNADRGEFHNISPCQSSTTLDSMAESETMTQSCSADILEYESIPSHSEVSDNGAEEESSGDPQQTAATFVPSEQETVIGEDLHLQYDELLKEHTEMSAGRQWSREQITEALMAAQNPQAALSPDNAQVLTYLLTHPDQHLKHAALQSIARCGSFTQNQDLLREHGCLPNLSKLLELQRMAMWLRHANAASTLPPTINAITNLAVNQKNNEAMAACVPTLVDISLDQDTGETVCLSSLQALTNLSVTSTHHGQYTRLVQRLYELLAQPSTSLRLQALKILVNLSCNPDMVPHLLAAKAPDRLMDLLQPAQTDETVVLRVVTLLANILLVVKEKRLTSSSLPPEDKAASPETMYSALLGLNNLGNLKNKVFLLSKHSNDEIRLQAIKVYNQLK